MKFRLTISVIFLSVTMAAQNTIKGKITDSETRKPVAGASVFISNTVTGTSADKDGVFILGNIKPGKYELIISSVGYSTYVFSFSNTMLPLELEIQLILKPKELEAVIVKKADKDGWKKWGSVFQDYLIGRTEHAGECMIQNKEAVRFYYSETSRKLEVSCIEPLIIENKALGYKIQYQLEEFFIDYLRDVFVYTGYPLLEEMKPGSEFEMERWKRNRLKAYRGSMKHFLYASLKGRLKEEGFEVVRVQLSETSGNKKENLLFTLSDSIAAITAILRNGIGIQKKNQLPGDSLIIKSQHAGAILHFKGFMYVNYKKQLESQLYDDGTGFAGKHTQRSVIFLLPPGIAEIDALGNYYPPKQLFSLGYWAWREKVAELLPLDYSGEK